MLCRQEGRQKDITSLDKEQKSLALKAKELILRTEKLQEERMHVQQVNSLSLSLILRRIWALQPRQSMLLRKISKL
jgi:hypothetical protein